jgi:hypothetical protein
VTLTVGVVYPLIATGYLMGRKTKCPKTNQMFEILYDELSVNHARLQKKMLSLIGANLSWRYLLQLGPLT